MQPIRILFDGDPAAATTWVGLAKKLARQTFKARIRNKTVQVADGVRIRVENVIPQSEGFGRGVQQMFGGLSKVWIEGGVYGHFLSTVWHPEGLLLTPRSSLAPYGYGFPKRTSDGERINPPFGTALASEETECMNQCLINRYANNKYLDKPDYITGLSVKFKLPPSNDQLRDSLESKRYSELPFFIQWPLCFTPKSNVTTFWSDEENQIKWTDEPGENSWKKGYSFGPFEKPQLGGSLVGRQFSQVGESLIYERETDEWYCHWPEEMLYNNKAYEEIFKQTNKYRVEVGRKPIFREVRGYTNHARMIITEMQRAKIQFHDSDDKYRPGYGTFRSRAFNASAALDLAGENLVSGIGGTFSELAGNRAAVAWRNSPLHYANMVDSRWSDDGYCTSLDVFGGTTITVTESGQPYPNTFDPPIYGTSYAQIFSRRGNWLMTGYVGNTNPIGRVSFFSRVSPVGNSFSGTGASICCWLGRSFLIQPIQDLMDAGKIITMLGSTVFVKDGVKWLRAILTQQEPMHGAYFMSYVLDTEDLDGGWSLEVKSPLFEGIVSTTPGQCTFNVDGSIGVFSICRLNLTEQAEFFLPRPPGQPKIITVEQVAIQYTDSEFTILEVVQGPDMTYSTVEDISYGESTAFYEFVKHTQQGQGEISLFPTYNNEGDLVRLKLNTSVFVEQERDTYDDNTSEVIEGKDEVNIHEYIVFPSEKELVTTHYHLLNKEFVGDAYYIVVFYLDLVHEDIVYGRIDMRIDTNYVIMGTLSIYVNDTLVKTFAEQTLAEDDVWHTPAYYGYDSSTFPDSSTPVRDPPSSSHEYQYSFVRGLRSLAFTKVQPNNGGYTVLGRRSYYGSGLVLTVCVSKPDIKFFHQFLFEGTSKMSLGGRGIQYQFCYSGDKGIGDYLAASYNPLFPSLYSPDQSGLCVLARYQDRILVQFYLTKVANFDIPVNDQKFIYSNFDINSLVNIGDMNWVFPIGVV